jgi:hypothetical protein
VKTTAGTTPDDLPERPTVADLDPDRARAIKLTPRAREVLRLMVDHADDEDGDGELVGEHGVWYVGLERTSWRVVKQLLWFGVIKVAWGDEAGDGRYQAYVATGEARRALDDPGFVPLFVRALEREAELAKTRG